MHNSKNGNVDALGLEVTEHANAMLAYWDRNLICRFANKAYIEWFGFDPEQMINKMHISQVIGPQLFQSNLVHINAVLNGQVQVFERLIPAPSGQTKTGRATYIPDIVDGKVKGFYVHVADVSPLEPSAKNVTDSIDHYVSSLDDTLIEIEQTLRSSILKGFPGIGNLAKEFFISESKLKRDFKEKYKATIFSYYRDLQMELAHKYISEKKCTKSQMALMFNFSNPSNFSLRYKKYLDDISVKQFLVKIKKESEERYKTFVAQLPVEIAMFDTDLVYLAASEKWINRYEHLRGKSFMGKCLYDLAPGVKEKYGAMLDACLKGEVNINDEALIERMHGAPAWLRWDVRPWHNAGNEIGGLLMMTEDISEVKLKEAEKKVIADILEKASEIARVGIWQRNFRTNGGVWSKILKEILEVPDDFYPDVSTGLNFYREGPHRDLVKLVIKNALEKGQAFDVETEIITAKGNLKKVRVIGFPELIDGKCEKISGIFQDITHNISIH